MCFLPIYLTLADDWLCLTVLFCLHCLLCESNLAEMRHLRQHIGAALPWLEISWQLLTIILRIVLNVSFVS